MDLSHRLPYPDPNVYNDIFPNGTIKSSYRDLSTKNVKKISLSLSKFVKMISTFDETEVFACFNVARNLLFNNSPKIRRDALFIIIETSKTSLFEHTIPYLLLMAHDDNAQIKQDSTTALATTSKKAGGLKKVREIVVSALGSMGAVAFDTDSELDAEGILGKSRIASSVCSSAAQILTVMSDVLQPREKVELLQYIRKATQGLVAALQDIDNTSNETLFYNQRLRSCLFKLHQESLNIERCPHPTPEQILLEKDPQCVKFSGPLFIKLCTKDNYKLMLKNSLILNEYYQEFLKNSDDQTINISLSCDLTTENMITAVTLLIDHKYTHLNIDRISKNSSIWECLPEKVLLKVIECSNPVDPNDVVKYSKYYTDVDKLEFVSNALPEQIADALLAIAQPEDIIMIESKWPSSTNKCIRKWQKSPKTDWWSEIIKDNLRYFIEDDCGAVAMTVPVNEAANFANTVAQIVSERLTNGQEISEDMWYSTSLTNSLIDIIIERNPDIKIQPEKKQDIYTAIYQNIILNTDESEAGEMIGQLSLSSQTSLIEFPNSYEFLSHFFKVVSIADVPENVELQYLKDYFEISYTDFLLHVFLGIFDKSALDSSVSIFLYSIPLEKRQKLIEQAIKNNFIDSTVALLISCDEKDKLRIPDTDWLCPYLSIMNIKFENNSPFARFWRNEKINFDEISSEEMLWVASREDCTAYMDTICHSTFPVDKPINFHLFITALLNASLDCHKTREFLEIALQSLDNLTQLDPQTVTILSECFCLIAKLPPEELMAFLSSITSILASSHSNSIVSCLHAAIPVYLQDVPRERWVELRDSLSTGPVSGLIEFDNYLSQLFNEDDLSLFREFPAAAAKYYLSSNRKDELRDLLSGLSNAMIQEELERAEKYSIENIEITVDKSSSTIHAESISTDDPFTLDVILPDKYPLEQPFFRVSSIGKEKLTQDARDEVKKECLRRDGIFAAISTWAARIDSVVSKVETCPICLSLLDARMNLPKMKCSTCHKCCHASCLEKWLRNSLKKNCPFCRTRWHRQK